MPTAPAVAVTTMGARPRAADPTTATSTAMAGTAFEDLCENDDNTLWRDYACGMATLSDEMERLRSEGEPHGAAALYQR